MKLRSLLAAALAALACAGAIAQQIPQPKLETVQLQSGMYLIQAEVAGNTPTRMVGMMMREKMGANEGMLFLFPDKREQCMLSLIHI